MEIKRHAMKLERKKCQICEIENAFEIAKEFTIGKNVRNKWCCNKINRVRKCVRILNFNNFPLSVQKTLTSEDIFQNGLFFWMHAQ